MNGWAVPAISIIASPASHFQGKPEPLISLK
jgi:hypothetical protein